MRHLIGLFTILSVKQTRGNYHENVHELSNLDCNVVNIFLEISRFVDLGCQAEKTKEIQLVRPTEVYGKV